MSHSRASLLGWRRIGGRRRHHVTMIEVGTRWAATRRAKIAFWAVGVTVAMCTAVIASGITHTAVAVLIGLLAGLALGGLVGVTIFCWPALRVAWHWAAEVTALALVLIAYLLLVQVMAWWAALSLLALALVGPFGLPGIRRVLLPWLWCVIVRHRLRLCFAAFITSQRWGATPLVLLARPVPAGERVWIWLRPGLALGDLESRLDRLAAGCWAAECRITPASRRYAALVRIDITRRRPLENPVGSPLPHLVPAHAISAGLAPVSPAIAPTGLDLPDIAEPAPATMPDAKRRLRSVPAAPATPEPSLSDIVSPTDAGDDLADWI